MTEIIHEIEEEHRRKKLDAMWKKYRIPLMGGAALLISGVAALQGWRYYQGQIQAQSSEAFMKAGELFAKGPGSEKEAIAAMAKIAETGTPGYVLIARLNEAAARSIAGETAKAVDIYDTIAASGVGGKIFSDFARYRAALLLVDTAPRADLQNRLEPVATGTGPWATLSREVMAYAAWRGGDLPDAQKRYDLLANDETAPRGLRTRAKNMLELISLGVKTSGVAPTPVAAQAPTADVDLLPPSLVTPEIPQGQ